MSLHGRSGLGSAVLGTEGEQILHALDQPVLVVGRHCSTGWPGRGGLLLPLDGSPEASRILVAATALARSWDLDTAVLQVVHAFDNEVAEQVEVVERACSDLRLAGVRVSSEVECSSNTAVAIVGHARRGSTSLIMMASVVHPGVARTLLGSVTMNTIRDAPCPVLVCPPEPVASAPLLSTVARPARVGYGGHR
jgi:nucleotide-binding universal stress UspA family protein